MAIARDVKVLSYGCIAERDDLRELLARWDVSAISVEGNRGIYVGILTDADFAIRSLALRQTRGDP
ncbi:hypothetical protein BN77_p250013 [Rhizobium mesoamericanum STM3625]|uniref:Uncharacterized protein n=1 Tax=Rhizobium mesoamericanum STM3625 TaxID=1211777 RepID=K0Q1K3_9HYPH|nr:hypothetical protein BN77_p250013 [Rhizobium mesoamericanum STM3625]